MTKLLQRARDPSLSLKIVSQQWGINLRWPSKRAFDLWDDGFEETRTERIKWIKENCIGDVYETYNVSRRFIYYFRQIEDAVLYKLRWE